MNHLGTKHLETERLLLRPFVRSDAQAMYDNWAKDPEVTKYLTWPAHGSAEVSQRVCEEWVAGYSDEKYYQWAIVPKNLGEPIGSISVVQMKENVELMHIGYCIGRDWWRQGITSEALAAVIAFLVEQVGAKKIEARHDPRNPNSGSVMLKCGLKYEGTLRHADINNQGICDASYYGLLADEYYAAKQGG